MKHVCHEFNETNLYLILSYPSWIRQCFSVCGLRPKFWSPSCSELFWKQWFAWQFYNI